MGEHSARAHEIEQRPVSIWAWLTFALAWIPFLTPATIACGHVALRELKRRGEAGYGLALAGLILGYVALVVYVIIIIGFLAGISAIGDDPYSY